MKIIVNLQFLYNTSMTAKNSSHSHESSVSDLLQLDQENQEFNFALEFILNHPQPVLLPVKREQERLPFETTA